VDKGIGDVRQRIKDDRAEKDFQAPEAVSQQPPKHAAEHHPTHLPVEEPRALGHEFVAFVTEARQAACADDEEQDEVVDIDEIAKRADDDGGMEHRSDDLARRVGGLTADGHPNGLAQSLCPGRGRF